MGADGTREGGDGREREGWGAGRKGTGEREGGTGRKGTGRAVGKGGVGEREGREGDLGEGGIKGRGVEVGGGCEGRGERGGVEGGRRLQLRTPKHQANVSADIYIYLKVSDQYSYHLTHQITCFFKTPLIATP